MSDSTDKKKYIRRRSIWNRADKLPVILAAIRIYRNGDMTIVQIEKTFKISPRTFRRYIEWSKNPGSPFYMDEIPKQKSELIPRRADPFVLIPPDQISSCRFDKIDIKDVIDV
jgi:hypothetical protein